MTKEKKGFQNQFFTFTKCKISLYEKGNNFRFKYISSMKQVKKRRQSREAATTVKAQSARIPPAHI